MNQAFGIADTLISENNKRVERSNLILGSGQIESDVFSTLTGQQDPAFLKAQLEVTLRDRFGHLTVDQQRSQLREMLTASLTALGSGAYGIDALNKIGIATTVLNMEVDGEPVFSPAEKQRAGVDLLVRAEATAKREMESEIGRLRESYTEVITLPNGDTVFRPNPNADVFMTTEDIFTKLTPIDDAANKVLSEMGLLGAEALTPEGQRIVNAVRQAARAAGAKTLGRRVQTARKVANHDVVLTGEPGGDANDAHRMSMFSRSHMSDRAAQASDTPPMGAREIEKFKVSLAGVAEGLGVDASVVSNWDGSTIEYTDENADLNKVIATAEALQWSNEDTQAQYGIPSELAGDKLALLGSNDPNRLEAFGQWAQHPRSGVNESWDNFLSAEGVSAQEAAAAQWVRMNRRQGRPRFVGDEVLPGNFEVDPAVMLSEVQAILKSGPVNSWLGGDTGLIDIDSSNAKNLADVMAEIVKGNVKLEGDDKDRFGRRIQAQFQRMFLSDGDHTGRLLRNLWFAGRAAEPDLNDGQRGAMLWTWLRQDGYRWKEVNDRQVLIVDPQHYTGPEGTNIQEFVDTSMDRQFTGLYRSFLQEALDLEPFEVPNNLKQLFLVGTAVDLSVSGTEPVRGKWGMADQTTDRLLESRANYGGFFIEGRGGLGDPLAVPIAKQDTLMRWPDGTTFMVPKGTILSVINPDLFAPPRRLPRARRRSLDLRPGGVAIPKP